MRKMYARMGVAIVAAMAFTMLAVTGAFAAVDSGAVTAVEGGAGDLSDTLVAVAVAVLPYAVAVIAVLLGWRLARRFIRA